ncbi:MAG: hypothetical protein RLY85_291 [Bacteroidota bacterium]|jgi:uncharacterized membrane protein
MKPFRPARVLYYFFQGLVVLAPIVITAWTVVSLFNFIDDILPNLLHVLFPDFVVLDASGYPKKVPGLGFLVVVLLVLMVGYVSSTFIVSRLLQWFDNILERTPGIKIIYSTVKDFLEAFAGNKRKFTKPVLVAIESPDIWRIGFITQQDVSEFGLKEHVAVYVPHSYAFSGVTYLVKQDRIRKVEEVSSADAMKFIVSGGVTEVEGSVEKA